MGLTYTCFQYTISRKKTIHFAIARIFSLIIRPAVIDRKACLFNRGLIHTTSAIFNKARRPMDPKLIRQFIIFLVILFGWTIAALLIGCK